MPPGRVPGRSRDPVEGTGSRVQLGPGGCRAQHGEHTRATVVGGRTSQPDHDPARAAPDRGQQESADAAAGAALRLPLRARGEVQADRLRGLDVRRVPDAQDGGGHALPVRVRDRDAEQVTAERRVEHLDEPRSAVGHRHLLDHSPGACRAQPSAIAAAASSAERVPANLSGATTIRMGGR